MSKLPDFLKLSPEKIAENTAQDAALRQKLASRIQLSPFEHERARALTMEDEQRKIVKSFSSALTLAKKVAADGIANISPTGIDQAREQLNITKSQLAMSLAAQGKFLDAARQTTDSGERKHYRKIAAAVWEDDEKVCKCDAPTGIVNGEQWTLPKYRIVRRVYSLKHSSEMALLECVVCGDWNVRPLTEDLVKIGAAVGQTQMTGKPVSDAEIFKDK